MKRITIVYNNKARENLKSGWGFSCLIDTGTKKVLFDTGPDGPALIENLNELNIKIDEIDALVISHDHWDHTGGIFNLFDFNSNLKIYFPEGMSKTYLDEVRKRADVYEVGGETKIFDGLYSTGTLEGNPDEQSIILETDKGPVVVVGCSHSGVGNILNKAGNYGKVYAILGGLHDFSGIQALSEIELIMACHCTKNIESIKSMYPQRYKPVFAGDVITL